MAQNLTQPSPYEDEIDLREIIKILIEYKKLIISTTLIFTIASIIFSLSLNSEFKSSVLVETGYLVLPDGTQKLIEEPSDLISNLNIYQLLSIQDEHRDTSFKVIENKLILIDASSSSGEKNENLLNEIIRYIDERHSNIAALVTNRKKTVLSQKIEIIESEISFIKENQLIENQLKHSKIKDRIAILESELPIIYLEISQIEKVIIEDTNNLSLLKRNNNLLAERASISPTLEQIIFSYNREINNLNAKKYNNILETENLNNQLISLENDTLKSDVLFRLEQEQKTLENQLQLLMTQTQIKTRPIRNIETNTIKPKTQLIILLGIIIGFITSIFLVIINNFIKSYREIEA